MNQTEHMWAKVVMAMTRQAVDEAERFNVLSQRVGPAGAALRWSARRLLSAGADLVTDVTRRTR